MNTFKGFASDNNAAVHPEVLSAIEHVNVAHAIAYGDDPYTKQAKDLIRKELSEKAEVFFVFNGTAANTLGLKAASHSFHSIICAQTAHIQVDECGAPEKFTGCKLLPVPTSNGKLRPEDIAKFLHGFGFEHHSQPKIISISQTTELGTVYTPNEIREIADLAHAHNMYLHMDGARIANAAVSLQRSMREFTADAGVDILSLGGTKNGMMYGEAIVFFRPELAENFKYYRKQSMQLASKMRYIAAQFIALFSNDLWKRNATNANEMAKLLEEKIEDLQDIVITQRVDANGIFAIIPKELIEPLQKDTFFYVWDENRNEVRWMTSWDTTEEEVEHFAHKIAQFLDNLDS